MPLSDDFPDAIVPRLYERDIDVLLQEELVFNDHVRSLFARRLEIDGPLAIRKCNLSVYDPTTGETDVLATFAASQRSGILLIENKIDASFQPQQPERYRTRALALGDALTVLIAPNAYLQSAQDLSRLFDAVVSYEELAQAIEAEATLRSRHRATLIRSAVEHSRKAYVAIPDEEVTAFWHRIFQIADREFAVLNMSRPAAKGSSSYWIIFKADLPPNITLDWKVPKSTVELNFWKSAAHRPIPTIDLTNLGAALATVGKGTVIRQLLSQAPQKWTEITDAQVREALDHAVRLLTFYRENPSLFA